MAETVIDLGKKAKAQYPGAYDHLDDAELGRKMQAQFPGAYDHYIDVAKAPPPSAAPPRTWSQKLGLNDPNAVDPIGSRVGGAAVDLAEGIASGVASTVYHGGDLLRRAMGSERIINQPDVQRAMTPPPTFAGRAGYGAEQAGEFLVPAGVVGRAEKVVQGATAGMRAAKALQLGARMGLEAGSAAGVAGLQTGGDPTAMRQAAGTAGAVTGGLGLAGMAAKGAAPWLKQSALRQYEKVLNPTKEKFKYTAHEKVVPELLERGKIITSLEKLQAQSATQVQKWGQALDDAYAKLPPGSAVELGPVLKQMDDMIEPLRTVTSGGTVTKGPVADQAIAHMEQLMKVVKDHAEFNPVTKTWEIPVDRIRALRQHFDDIASEGGAFHGKTLAEKNMVSTYEKSGNAIRAELAKPYPDIATINKEYSFHRSVKDVTDATLLRRTGQAQPLGRKIAAGVGTTVGAAIGQQLGGGVSGAIAGAAIGYKTTQMLETAFTSPLWRTVSAVSKAELADAIAKGNGAQVEFVLRKIGIGAASGSRALERFDAANQPALKVDVPGKAPMQVYR